MLPSPGAGTVIFCDGWRSFPASRCSSCLAGGWRFADATLASVRVARNLPVLVAVPVAVAAGSRSSFPLSLGYHKRLLISALAPPFARRVLPPAELAVGLALPPVVGAKVGGSARETYSGVRIWAHVAPVSHFAALSADFEVLAV